MKTKGYLIPLAFVVFFSAIACQEESTGGSIQCFTTDARSISASSYELLGSARFSGEESYSGDAYFYYSKDDGGKSELLEKGTRLRAGQVSSSNPDFKATLSNVAYGTTYYYVAAIQVMGEEYLGSVKSFTTQDKPVLGCGTGDASDITEISATIYGYSTLPRTELGGATVGFIYSTSTEPTLSNGKSKSSKEFLSDTQFVATITGLTPGTKYYYRSYLLQNGNYLYGAVSSFTTASINAKVTTNSAQNISEHGATISGSLSLTSIAKLNSSVALYYSDKYTSREEIKANGTKVSVTPAADGSFSKDLTNLPHSTSYSYIAFATVEGIEFFGEVVQFRTTDINASLQTDEANNITEHKATINGSFNLVSTTSSTPSVCFYFSDKVTSKEDLKASGKRLVVSSIPSNGMFSYSLTNLTHSTTYYYVAYTKVEDVEFFGEVRSFNTLSINAAIITGDASSISEHKATVSGKFNQNTIEQISAVVSLYYSSSINDKAGLVKNGKKIAITSFDPNGSFSTAISSLSHSTTYYYVAYAKLEDVEFFGEVKSFSTRTIQGTATTGNTSGISEHKATLSGSFVLNSIETLQPEVSILYSSSAKTASALKSSGLAMKVTSLPSNGQFSIQLDKLNHSTTYYYMTYVKVEGVIFEGTVKTFKTPSINASVKTGSATGIKYHNATLNGSVSINTIENLSASSGFYYSSSASSQSTLKQNGTKVTVAQASGSISTDLIGDATHQQYYYMAYLQIEDVEFLGEVKSFKMKTVPNGAVDLGLSVLWAEYNVGAKSPQETGNYYLWGTVKPETPDPSISTKYGDNNTTLLPEDDAAHYVMGSEWRMPTYSEMVELATMCSKSEGSYSGVRGFYFTSKVNGFEGKKVFLPDVKCKEDYCIYHHNNTYYWTASYDKYDSGTNYNNSWAIFLSNNSAYQIVSISQTLECPIRAVFP